MEEIYKSIKGYEGLYEVSNFGNVRSLDRIVPQKWIKSKTGFKKYKGKNLKCAHDKFGYPAVTLSKESKLKQFRIHQLVAFMFLNHEACGFKLVVDHIDKNPKNNNIENLRLISHRDNVSRRSNKTSKYTGVCWHIRKLKWTACIQIDKKNYHLGYFDNEEEAKDEYQKKLNERKISNV